MGGRVGSFGHWNGLTFQAPRGWNRYDGSRVGVPCQAPQNPPKPLSPDVVVNPEFSNLEAYPKLYIGGTKALQVAFYSLICWQQAISSFGV